jgi:pimeloyl-ACP methyl ester carboxylesterase
MGYNTLHTSNQLWLADCYDLNRQRSTRVNKALVFIHGAGDSARAWREQVACFGQRAYAIDLPGHGERPDTLPASASVADYAQAVHSIVRDELQLAQPIMVGHSLGGLIALQLGLDFSPELGGLILIGSGARMRVLPALLQAARAQPGEALRTLKNISLSPQSDPTLATHPLNEQPGPAPGILYRDLAACNSFDVMERLAELRTLPTLIICGAQERNAPVKYSQYLHTHIAGSTLEVIADAGHYVQREKPAEVNQAIARWLENS